jgi:hypothetical protein
MRDLDVEGVKPLRGHRADVFAMPTVKIRPSCNSIRYITPNEAAAA